MSDFLDKDFPAKYPPTEEQFANARRSLNDRFVDCRSAAWSVFQGGLEFLVSSGCSDPPRVRVQKITAYVMALNEKLNERARWGLRLKKRCG